MKRFVLALAVVAVVVLSASTGNAQERHGGSNYYRSYTNSRGPIHSNHSSYDSRNYVYSRGGSVYRSNYDPSCRPNYGGYGNYGHSSYYRGGSSYYRSGYNGYGYGDYGYGYGSPYGSRGFGYSNGGVFLYYGF